MGWGIAMVSGVSMNGWASVGAIAGWPWSARRWLRMAPHDEDAGDQITGRGPSVFSSHPPASNVWAAPDAFRWGRTKTHLPSTLSPSWLKDFASALRRSIFSGD